MRTIEIYIDGLQMDYTEIKSIPLSLRKRTDKFLEIVGADGSEVDNVLRSITFPDTLKNQKALISLLAQSSKARGSTRHNVKVVVNGIMLFYGDGVLKKATKRSLAGPSCYLELLGDGIGLWEKLEKVKLNSLELGSLTWTFAEVTANWNDHEFDDYPAYWCPVVYGNVVGDGYMSIREFRPSIPFWRIFKAIFESQGYTIDSEFYQTLFFRRHAYLFGVGDKWKNDLVVDDYHFKGEYIGRQIPWGLISGGSQNAVFDATEDPSGMYFDNGFSPRLLGDNRINPPHDNHLIIQQTGWYKIKVTANIDDGPGLGVPQQLFIQGVRGVTIIYDGRFVMKSSDTGGDGYTCEVEAFLEDGDLLYFLMLTDPINSYKIRVRLLDKPFLGSNILLSSCLHDKPVKEFLRGASHMFNLVWRVDDITKRVFFEPRFDYILIEDGEPVTRRGFYRRDFTPITGQIEASEVTVEYVTPFGDSLGLGYGEGSNDPLEKATLLDLGRDPDLKRAPYYADVELHDRGKDGITSNNPYFTTLYQAKPSDIKLRVDAYIPIVMPSAYKLGNHLPGMKWTGETSGAHTEDAPTFESEPKCGIMFPEALNFQFYYDEGEEALYYSETVNAPWITQQKWNDIGGPTALADWDNHCAYADLKARDSDRVIKGLVSTFYPNYISIIKEGQVLTGRIRMPLPTIANLSFRNMWRLPYDLNESIWILLELTGYKALVSDDSTGQFIKYVPPTKDDMDAVTHDDPNEDPIVPDIAQELEE